MTPTVEFPKDYKAMAKDRHQLLRGTGEDRGSHRIDTAVPRQ